MSWWTEALPTLDLMSGLQQLCREEGGSTDAAELRRAMSALAGHPREEPESARLARLIDTLFTQGRLRAVTGSLPEHYRLDQVLESGIGAQPLVAAMFCALAQQRGLKARLIHSITAPLTLLELDGGRCLCDTGAVTAKVWATEEWMRIQENALSRPLDPFEVDDAFQEVEPDMLFAEITQQLHDHAIASGDLASALRHAVRRVDLLPASPKALLECGRLYARLGMKAEAANAFTDYLVRWPASADAMAVGMQLTMLL